MFILNSHSGVDEPILFQPRTGSQDQDVFRPFLQTAMALVLTVGALWGALILIRMSSAGRFTSVDLHEVNAHGHAQIFGWVGLCIMGFGFHSFPRFKQMLPAQPRVTALTLGLMLTGILLRCIFEPIIGRFPAMLPLALLSGPLEIAAVLLFVWIVLASWRKSPTPLQASDLYILAGLCWFVIQTVYDSLYFTATALATSREELLKLVSVWQAPLRDFQIHGFALLVILGVGQRVFPELFGFGRPSRSSALVALILINAGVIGEGAGLIFMRALGNAWAGLWYAGILAILIGVIVLVVNWGVFGSCRKTDRSIRFIKTSYAWLIISLVMLTLLPVYQFVILRTLAPHSEAAGIGFSHAYYGAVRHAITVGFISMMIVGMSIKVVSIRCGHNGQSLPSLWPVYLLLNAGCATRVLGQTLTDFTSDAFRFTGVSGLLEVTALALWALHVRQMLRVPGTQITTPPDFQNHEPELFSHQTTREVALCR